MSAARDLSALRLAAQALLDDVIAPAVGEWQTECSICNVLGGGHDDDCSAGRLAVLLAQRLPSPSSRGTRSAHNRDMSQGAW